MFFRKIIIADKNRGRTRIIYNGDGRHIVSPIAPLLPVMAASVGQIVPERKEELQSLIAGGISIEIDGGREDFYVVSNVAGKTVKFGVAALERIWAYTYFYLTIVDEMQKKGPGAVIDLTATWELDQARLLGLWAHDCEAHNTQTPWPEGLPRPDLDDGSNDHIRKTNPYFYHAVCFMLLHEIAHIKNKDYPDKYEDKATAYLIEFRADKCAAKFMLDKWQEANRGEKDFIGRCTGIALGITILIGVELYHYASKDDHPNAAERLLKFFEEFNPESGGRVAPKTDFPKYFVTGIIHGVFQKEDIPFDFHKAYDDFTDYLIAAHRALEEKKG